MDQKYIEEMVCSRRKLHKIPEEGWTEFQTTYFVVEFLRGLGLPVFVGKANLNLDEVLGRDVELVQDSIERALKAGVPQSFIEETEGFTGAVAVLDTGRPGPTTAFRSDMDCVIVRETKDADHLPNKLGFAIVWFGGKAMDAGNMQVGEMIAFITYTMQIVMSFLMLAMVAVMLPRAGVAADRIDEVCRTKASIHDPDAATAKPALEKKGWDGVVRFEDVSFRFPGADSDALEHISFTANPGETTAIIGSTGCGKSSLLNLIPRFYDVTGGRVTIDGIDVREMPQEQLHSLLGYVPQKGVLFSGTIESNLKFGGAQITDAGMKKAASIAQATEFIDAKPEGYASPIAQGGSNVSGGQKQRLSIARAIAKEPKIYLFDDSFSALDYKTDVTLRRALKEETDNATVIIVAQRISTVLHANQILVLDDGRLVGKGTHAQLMATCPEYQEIARSQLSQKELNLQDLNTGKEDE